MTSSPSAPSSTPDGTGEQLRPRRRRRRVSVLGVVGELLITAGVVVLLFLGWQVWWNDLVLAGQQSSAASKLSESLRQAPSAEPSATPEPTAADYGEPAVSAVAPEGQAFAVMYVPRFGEGTQRTIASGVGTNVLNSNVLGVGHYPQTQAPGEVGNFAIASHRSAYGGGMHKLNELQLGDPIYIQTAEGWYTYRFRDYEYVQDTAIDVLAPVPRHPDASPTDRMITLTTCNPLYSTAERIVAYGVLESWQPASAGPPAEIAAQVAAWGA